MHDIPIRDRTIDLDQFLKLAGAAESGGSAKWLIAEGLVRVNGEPETRRRRTLAVGDIVAIEGGETFRVVSRV